ncbi:hypothetical protein RHDC4_03058 [Rhodocyclaceae bacterium]|nr:hypothetical protein RHDC4_03058 [Rhodocyclaceae bacterium]
MARSLVAAVAIAFGFLLSPASHSAGLPLQQPSWAELGPQQREVLLPLSAEWDRLEPWRRKKWLGIVDRYPAMGVEEQARIQRRMKDWIALAPEERKAVREKYKNIQKASPEFKETLKQKWQEYKELPDEEREKLKAEALKAKTATKPGGAAAAHPLVAAKPTATIVPPPSAQTATPVAVPERSGSLALPLGAPSVPAQTQ